jgi:DNA-binding SARP family transcriptional activator
MARVSVVVHLLGRPGIELETGPGYRFRSQKSWALLAYLLLEDRAPTRAHLAALLFDGADDPLRALRWSLAEVRRGLGEEAEVEGDPVDLRLPADAVVDVRVLVGGAWADALALPGLGHELLESLSVRGAAGFESWLLAERRRTAAAAEAIIHEAALGRLSEGRLEEALALAERAARLSPLDENNQALVLRIYRRMGDVDALQRHYAMCVDLFRAELGTAPGAAIESARREEVEAARLPTSAVAIEAIVEAGSAAVAAGAGPAGVVSLRTAIRLADETDVASLRIHARLVLAEALVHSVRGLDEEGLAALHAADRIASGVGDDAAVAEARTEMGYVDFLRGRYDRAEFWLTDALARAAGSTVATALAQTYLGCVDSDRADYLRALARLDAGIEAWRGGGEGRRAAYALSMRGRIHLLRGDLEQATVDLDAAIEAGERDRWLAFLPWPQALLGEVRLAAGDRAGAARLLEQAFARSCQLGDPCWEGISGRGLALIAEADGDVDLAFDLLADARQRCNRLADGYVWLDAYIIDAQCELGRRHGHEQTRAWVDALRTLASRTGMREMVVRSLLHAAALGDEECAEGARLVAAGIDSPALAALLEVGVPG